MEIAVKTTYEILINNTRLLTRSFISSFNYGLKIMSLFKLQNKVNIFLIFR